MVIKHDFDVYCITFKSPDLLYMCLFCVLFTSHHSWSRCFFSLAVDAPCLWHIWLAWPCVTQMSGKHLFYRRYKLSLSVDRKRPGAFVNWGTIVIESDKSDLWFFIPWVKPLGENNSAAQMFISSSYLVFIMHASFISALICFIHSWDRKNNPEPWNKLGPTDQYKVRYMCMII